MGARRQARNGKVEITVETAGSKVLTCGRTNNLPVVPRFNTRDKEKPPTWFQYGLLQHGRSNCTLDDKRRAQANIGRRRLHSELDAETVPRGRLNSLGYYRDRIQQ